MTVHIRFTFRGDRRLIGESDVVAAEHIRDELQQESWLGFIAIESAGQPTVNIEDEIVHEMTHLCRACVELVDGHSAAVPYWDMPGAFELTVDDDHVILTGDHVPRARYPIIEFAEAVLSCVERVIVFLRRLGDADFETIVELLRDAAAELKPKLARSR
jgi:hypothetical protein